MKTVDVLVVRASSTIGHKRSEAELLDALDALGVRWGVASTDYGLIDRLPLSLNLLDLGHALSIRWAVTRTLRTVAPRALIYAAAGITWFEPVERLNRAAIRFDALASQNRPERRHILQRTLERRVLKHAKLLLPFGAPSTWPQAVQAAGRQTFALPTPVERYAAAEGREATVVCYAGAPEKKRLDLLVKAWAAAGPPQGYRLLVTGIEADRGRRFLKMRGIAEPPAVTWCGPLPETSYRDLTSRATAYLAAARFEDYGIAQLEALADGALLVTVASEGPFEALHLARALDSRLVASEATPESLGKALRRALALDEGEQARYREAAHRLLEPYSRQAFRNRLRDQILPALCGSSTSEPS